MNKLFPILCAMTSAQIAFASATVSHSIVRQDWPFSSDVAVDLVVSGVADGAGVLVTATAYSGDTLLGTVPSSAVKTASDGVYASGDEDTTLFVKGGGAKSFTFDIARVAALSGKGRLENFRLAFTLADDENLYKIIDLDKNIGEPGQIEYVTAGALRAGLWGTYETNPSWLLDEVKANVETKYGGILFWTGITNDAQYAKNKIVLRRIKAGDYELGSTYAVDGGTAYNARHKCTFTKDYWIGAYEVTTKQVRMVAPKGNSSGIEISDSNELHPARAHSSGSVQFSFARIHGNWTNTVGQVTDYAWPENRNAEPNVDPKSLMGLLRARTGVKFDLPTSAQWEAAARGGSVNTSCYNGKHYPNTELDKSVDLKKEFNTMAAFNYVDAVQKVGSRLPNAFGLYDVLGNVREWVLDWKSIVDGSDLVDPVGPEAQNASKPYKVYKGGAYSQSGGGGSILYSMSYGTEITKGEADTGCRLCAPVEEGE